MTTEHSSTWSQGSANPIGNAAELPPILNVVREVAKARLLMVFAVTGMLFMFLPGTFLGVLNLINISHSTAPSAPWIQAHGHAQIFGWIGTFILGIGMYSIPKMRGSKSSSPARGWSCWAFWTAGVTLRWVTNISLWQWKWMLPISAALELTAFIIFFVSVRGHRSENANGPRFPVWVQCVVFGTIGFAFVLIYNLAICLCLSWIADGPAFPATANFKFLTVTAWAFLVPTVWGFSARWLPTFLGLKEFHPKRLQWALVLLLTGVIAVFIHIILLAQLCFATGVLLAVSALHVIEPSIHAPKTTGVHPSFPFFVRIAYVWLTVAAGLSIWASIADKHNGIWGASRHALTVGFIAGMVFAIGQRVLPAFAEMRVLFSPKLMLLNLLLLHIGCTLRVVNEILSYEQFAEWAWKGLPVSAVMELCAVSLFAVNMVLTFLSTPPHRRPRVTV